MKRFSAVMVLFIMITGCVPSKKYQELLEKEQKCSTELEMYKSRALSAESDAATFKAKYEVLEKDVIALRADTTKLGNDYRTLRAKYNKLAAINEALETNYDKLRLSGAKESAALMAELEARKLQLQQREDELMELEKELKAREEILKNQEARLAELNEIIRQQQDASRLLKDRLASALKNFENKGLTVVEKDGKIYVSLEAQLLFKSGSTFVEPEGKKALIELAKVLEAEKDLEVIVEGHTDTDKMNSTTHPKSNWELSVLRSTSVIEIMTANSKMDPAILMAAGRSEYHPLDPNDKAKNRRIEIIISPDLNALFELIKE